MKNLMFLLVFFILSFNLFAANIVSDKVYDYLLTNYSIDANTPSITYVGYKLSKPSGGSSTQNWYAVKISSFNAEYIQGKTEASYNKWLINQSNIEYYPANHMYDQDYK